MDNSIPNINFCKRIPKNQLNETFWVWNRNWDEDEWKLVERENATGETISAPTVVELIKDLTHLYDFSMNIVDGYCVCECTLNKSVYKEKSPGRETNITRAVMLLWLKVKG